MSGTSISITPALNFVNYNVLYCDAVDVAADLTVSDRDPAIQITYSTNTLKIITKANLETIKYFMILR